jgi:hypothetical protein
MIRRSLRALALLIALGGCHPPPRAAYPTAPGPARAEWADGGWKTLRAVHHARLTVGNEQRTLRGLVAVERPDKFRLRALGPAGITLFDVLYRNGEVKVLASLRDPSSAAVSKIVSSLTADLAAAYALAPRPPGRTALAGRDRVEIREPGRTIVLSGFVAPRPGEVAARRIAIDDLQGGYRVEVEASEIALDGPLDPALFTPP